jgi:hypothetical protein
LSSAFGEIADLKLLEHADSRLRVAATEERRRRLAACVLQQDAPTSRVIANPGCDVQHGAADRHPAGGGASVSANAGEAHGY